MNVFFVVFALGALQACTAEFGLNSFRSGPGWDPGDLRRVVNGKDANEGQYPWQVSLNLGTGKSFCGGSLISQNFILTAAHCVDSGLMTIESFVTVGRDSEMNDGTEQHLKVNNVIIHEGYDSKSRKNDIALLQLSTPIQLIQNVKAINIASSSPEEGTACVFSVWEGSSPNFLQHVKISIVNRGLCHSSHLPLRTVTRTMICARTQAGQGACEGDSGGSLVCNMENTPTLVGFASSGNVCGTPRKPSVFTNIITYKDWIKSHIGE